MKYCTSVTTCQKNYLLNFDHFIVVTTFLNHYRCYYLQLAHYVLFRANPRVINILIEHGMKNGSKLEELQSLSSHSFNSFSIKLFAWLVFRSSYLIDVWPAFVTIESNVAYYVSSSPTFIAFVIWGYEWPLSSITVPGIIFKYGNHLNTSISIEM